MLHYVKTKDGKEIDFLASLDGTPTHLIEVKASDDNPSSSFSYFQSAFSPSIKLIQLVKNCRREKTFPTGLSIRSLVPWLIKLNLKK